MSHLYSAFRSPHSAFRIPLIVLACALVAPAMWAQFAKRDFVKLIPPSSPKAAAGQTVEVPLAFEIASGFHINAEKPTFDYLIPTKLEWESKEFKLAGIEYPKPEQASFSFAPDTKLDVYQGTVTILSRFEMPKKAPVGKASLRGKLRYQACDDKACYQPATVPVEIPFEIAKKLKK